MKTHVPNRVAVAGEFFSKRQNAARFRRFALVVTSVLGGLLLLSLLVALVSLFQHLRRERDLAIAEHLKTLQSLRVRDAEWKAEKALAKKLADENQKLKDELFSEANYIAFLEFELEQLQSELKKTRDQQVKDAESSLSNAKASLDAALRSVAELQQQKRALAQQCLERILSTCDHLRSDPNLLEKECVALKEFATANGLDAELLGIRLNSLSKPMPVPSDSSIAIHGISREGKTVIVDFTVKDGAAKRIEGISRRELDVLDGPRRVHAVEVTETTERIGQHHLAVLLDVSGSMDGPPRNAMVEGAQQLFRSLPDSTRVKVWTFANDVTAVSPWSIDPQIHEAAIQNIRADGATALYKSLRLAVDEVKSLRGKRSIILFTDGSDSFHQESLDAIIDQCRQSDIAVQVVSLRTAETKLDLLQRIASATSGALHEAGGVDQVATRFAEVSASLKQRLYRLRISEPLDSDKLTLSVGNLPGVSVQIPETVAAR